MKGFRIPQLVCPRAIPLVLLVFLTVCFTGPKAAAEIPRGVFAMLADGANVPQDILSNPHVVGITLGQGWNELEPSEGQFEWSYLDSQIAVSAAAGKVVLLRIATQLKKPAWVTTAIQNAGGTFFTFVDDGETITIPVFWDPTYLAKKKAMIRAVGAHFTKNSAIKIVATSFANARTEDWNVPHTTDDVQNWLAAGYTTDKLLAAGKQIIDATMAAFPNQYVTLAIGGSGHVHDGPNLDSTATYAAETAIATANGSWPGRLIVQINSVATTNPEVPGGQMSAWNTLWNNRPNVAGQMVSGCYDEPTYRANGFKPGDPATVLTECFNSAASYGLNYLEVYRKDVENLQDIIAYGDGLLNPVTANALLNVSTRLQIGSGDNAAISGFIVSGTGTKKVMLRAIGPSLARQGVTGSLADPVLELHDATGATIATNNNWETTQLSGVITSDQVAAITASTIAPTDPNEAALIADLGPGAYTAVVQGNGNDTGIGLAEVYDLGQAASASVANLSTRGFVGTEADVLIGGFILGGTEPSSIVVRALGPSLTESGVTGTLRDPVLNLYDSEGTPVGANDNWAETQAADLQQAGLAPTDAKEAAIKLDLSPGSYTATVSGKAKGSGVALVEVYRLP